MPNNKKNTAAGTLYAQICLSDHRRDVAGLSAEERGVYESLRVACYQQGGALPADNPTLFRLAEAFTARERKAVAAVLDRKFTLEADGWHNAQCDAEIARVRHRRMQQQTAALTRWNAAKSDAHALHVDVQTGMPTVNLEPMNLEPNTNRSSVTAVNKELSSNARPASAGHIQPLLSPSKNSVPPGEHVRRPWGDDANYAAWRADRTTGYAPTEEQQRNPPREATDSLALIAKGMRAAR
jgi:uncharacterized protein YdaU (DUF1376 family)